MGECRIKPWLVSVDGYGESVYFASSRGRALADAWRCDAFCGWSFKIFLMRSRCTSDRATMDARFGEKIEVNGRPAFFIGSNRQYVQMAWPDSDHVSNAHPLEVKPIEYRPETYRSEKFDAL